MTAKIQNSIMLSVILRSARVIPRSARIILGNARVILRSARVILRSARVILRSARSARLEGARLEGPVRLDQRQAFALFCQDLTSPRRRISALDVGRRLDGRDAAEIARDSARAIVGRRSDAGLTRHEQAIFVVDE